VNSMTNISVDAEVEAAALKIQASFKGYQTRKQLVRFPNKLK